MRRKFLENFCYRNKSIVCCLWSSVSWCTVVWHEAKENSRISEALSTSLVLLSVVHDSFEWTDRYGFICTPKIPTRSNIFLSVVTLLKHHNLKVSTSAIQTQRRQNKNIPLLEIKILLGFRQLSRNKAIRPQQGYNWNKNLKINKEYLNNIGHVLKHLRKIIRIYHFYF